MQKISNNKCKYTVYMLITYILYIDLNKYVKLNAKR